MTKKQIFFIFAALALITAVYANSLQTPFYFDDNYIIDSVKLENLSLKSLVRSTFHSLTKNRPLANLTLALNYYFATDKAQDTFLYHILNIGIHLACFLFVFLFLKEILALPAIPQRYRDKAFPLSLIAAVVWAVHPIQTQAVTYIVQRMTSLCALFYLMSLYFYIKARTRRKRIFYLWSGLAFLLALGSKEIAATIPLAVLLMEWLLLRGDKKKILAVVLVFILCFAAAAYFFMGGQFKDTIDSLKQNKYSNRSFLISERLLTEPRVFVHYISLVLFPYYNRFILDYDFKVSRSLVAPITTLLAVLFILGTVGLALFIRRKNPLAAYCVFAFWLGHIIEGSVLNLEIVFEHRMYLPSVFLIFGLAAAASDLAVKINLRKRVGLALLGIVLLYLGINTFLKNESWNNPLRFFKHEVQKSPGNFRTFHNLGITYAYRQDFENALINLNKALKIQPNSSITYFALGQLYYLSQNYEMAIPFYDKSLSMRLEMPQIYINLSVCYIRLNKIEEGAKVITAGYKKFEGHRELAGRVGALYYFLAQELGRKGRDLMEKEGIDEAKAFFLLETSYRVGNREKDVFANLAPAYIAKAKLEPDPQKRAKLVTKAKAIAIEGRQRFPQDDDLRRNLVGVYCVSGEWRDALKIEGLTKEDFNILTVSLFNGERFRDALELLNKAESQFGSDQVIEFNRAICFYYLGDKNNAIELFKKIQAATSNIGIKMQAQYFIDDWIKNRVQK